MAAVRAHTRDAIMDLDRTMHDESILDSGDDSDVMDNIVFRRPVTRGSLKAATSAPVASTSTQPARRRSPRKGTNMSPPPRPTLRSRRISSQTTSSPSSSQSHSQSLTPSQSEPQVISDEPTGMSQDLARVSVVEEAETDVPDVGMDTAEPHAGEPALGSPPNLMDMDAQLEPKDDSTDAKETGARTDGALGTRSAALVFETETERASEGGSQTRDKPSTSSRTLLALPVFTVTTLGETSTEEEPSHSSLSISDLGLGPGSQTIDSTSSIENMTDSDISIPASFSSADGTLAPPLTNTPRRSPRLSGSSASTFVPTVFSTVPPRTVQTSVSTKVIVTPTAPAYEGVSNTHPPLPVRATRPTKKGKAKAPARELGDGPTGPSHDAPVLDPNTITTSSKGKEKEQPLSPAIIPRIKNDTLLKPPQLRSLSPDSDAVLASLHQVLSPQTRPALRHLPKSSDRPAPPPSAMKRRAEEEPASPEKRARFDPDPPPPTQPPAPLKQPPLNHARPARIRVHPSNSLVGMAHQVQQSGSSSFVGAHPPIVVRPTGSPSRQQLLLQRNPGPPMRVPVGQPQRIMFPARVPSPVRTGSTNSMGMSSNIIRSTSPLKPQRGLNAKLGIWGPPAIAPAHIAAPNRGAQSSQIKADVLIAPRDGGSTRAPADGSSSPARAGRSRLPVLKASSGVLRTTGEKAKGAKADADDANESGLPPAGTATGSLVAEGAPAVGGVAESAGGETLQVPGSVSRERTPPTPLETPGSPGSSSSTLIMEVPLFYQPPTPRLPPIQQRTAEEIIAEGTAREAQRKRERQAQTPGNAAAAAAAALHCLPLSRARRIIPDGSSLQAWPSASGLTETQKELQRITQANTERNTAYVVKLERTEAYKDAPRPPSPTSRIRTKAQKAKEMERQSRDERALRRSASRVGGDPDMSAVTADMSEAGTSDLGPVLAPGDEEEWTSPGRPGRHVRWERALAVGAGAGAGSEPRGVGRGCLARTYELDRHGNARNVCEAEVEAERVVVVRYVYSDEKGRKKR